MKKLNNNIVDQRLCDRNIKRIDDYIDKETPIRFQCLMNNCNYIWMAKPGNIFSKRGCPQCVGLARLSDKMVDQKLIDRNIIRLENIINNKTAINFQCSVCNHIWNTSVDSVLNRNTGCPNCNKTLLSNKDVDILLENKNIKRIDNYVNGHTKIMFQCLIENCNYYWTTSPAHILYDGTGCPNCSSNKNETIIYNTLRNNDVKVEKQKSIKKIIKNENRNLVVDFYTENIIIEYNGKQHYQPVCFGGCSLEAAKINLDRQKGRDQYLQRTCDTNNIKLIWIDGRVWTNSKLEKYVTDHIIPVIKNWSNFQ